MDISIIIPTYNRLWSLPKAIISCFDPNVVVEVIVIDDGSTDGTWEWLTKQENIITLRQENKGKDWAVNEGFKIARGKYIRFLDSDDWHLPGSSALLFNKAEKGNLDIVCAGYQLVDEHEKLIHETTWVICDDFLAQQLGECDSSHYSAYLFKRAFIIDVPHRQEYGALDDRQFMIEIAMKWPKTGYITNFTMAHRTHSNERLQIHEGLKSAMQNYQHYTIYKKALAELEKNGKITERYKKAPAKMLWHLAHWLAKKDIRIGKEIYNWVYELDPGFIPKGNKTLDFFYKVFGFKSTEKLLSIKRNIRI